MDFEIQRLILNLIFCYVYYKCFVNNPLKNPIRSYLGMRNEVLLNTELSSQLFAIPIELSICHIDWIISEYSEVCSNLSLCSNWDEFIMNWFENSWISSNDNFSSEKPEKVVLTKRPVKKIKVQLDDEEDFSNDGVVVRSSANSGKCSCRGDCSSKRCSCNKNKQICSSKCHSGRICQNKN